MVEILAHGEPDFGGQHDLLPHTFQGVTNKSLALPEAVHIRCIDEVDSPVQGCLHHPRGVLLTEVAHVHFAAELHRAKRQLAHDQSGVAQLPILHRRYSVPANKNCDSDFVPNPMPRSSTAAISSLPACEHA